MRRLLPLTLAFALALGWQLTPPAAQPVAAACTTPSCATLEIVFGHGAGTGLATTFPFGLDCEWTGSARAGTCVAQYDVGSGLDVTLYLDPGPHSYVCYGNTCGGLEARLVRTVRLNPGDNIDVFPVFNLANKTNVVLRTAGSGAGRVTTNPSGLDCRVVAGVQSGTCIYDYWYLGSNLVLTLHRNPDTGNYACNGPFSCNSPNTDFPSTIGMSPGGQAPIAEFWVAVPVTVSVSGSGTVVSNPAGISCPPTCSKWFEPALAPGDGPITLRATPAPGWFVKDWTGVCNTATESTCAFSNGYSGANVGVVFARLATPAPTVTPRPPATPKPTPKPSPRPSATPSTPSAPSATPSTGGPGTAAPSAVVIPGGSIDPGMSTEPASADPAGSQDPRTDPPAVAAVPSGGSPAGVGGTQAPASVGGPGQSATGDVTLLVALGIVVFAILLAIGFAVGRRRGADARR